MENLSSFYTTINVSDGVVVDIGTENENWKANI